MRPVVVVAPELEPFAAGNAEWPGQRPTVFAVPQDPSLLGTQVEALIPLVKHHVGPAVFDALPDLKLVANYGVGYDNIDLAAATRRGIVVTNTPDVLTDATADLTLALILATTRRLREGLELAVSGEWPGWSPTELLGMGLRGRVLGIVGAGRIGTAVARRAAGFGLQILYWNRSASPALETEVGATRCETLRSLLERSDVVSVHVALSAETTGLIGSQELRCMKQEAVLVNTARGPIVDEAALASALESGTIAAAGLDVYEEEPRIHAALLGLENAYLLPHLGSATRQARQGMWEVAAANVRAVLGGRGALNPVTAGRT